MAIRSKTNRDLLAGDESLFSPPKMFARRTVVKHRNPCEIFEKVERNGGCELTIICLQQSRNIDLWVILNVAKEFVFLELIFFIVKSGKSNFCSSVINYACLT